MLLAQTDTPTTGGFETVFKKKPSQWISPDVLLALSLGWSLFSCIKTHTNLISAEKGYCPMTSKLCIFAWGTFATLRRILSIIAMFAPSMGLFSLLNHWSYEQIPFRVRQEYAKKLTIHPDDKISLYGLDETFFWTEYDRWNYADPFRPIPPHYSHYTLLSLQTTFITFLALSVLQFLAIGFAKVWISNEFSQEQLKTNKIIHVLENLNLATPFKDWDDGNHTIAEFRARFKVMCKEMIATFIINFIFTLIMMIPSLFCGI